MFFCRKKRVSQEAAGTDQAAADAQAAPPAPEPQQQVYEGIVLRRADVLFSMPYPNTVVHLAIDVQSGDKDGIVIVYDTARFHELPLVKVGDRVRVKYSVDAAGKQHIRGFSIVWTERAGSAVRTGDIGER